MAEASEGAEMNARKARVKPETLKKWTRFILNALTESKRLESLYEVASGERISRTRVDNLLPVLEEAGVVKVEGGMVSLAEKEPIRLQERVNVLKAEIESLKAGLREVECAFLRPMDVVGRSGQRLFYCVKRELTLGEGASVCDGCRYKSKKPKKVE